MTFDDWMLGISECHKPGDDGVTLRMLRACWAEAQAVERERCAKVCDVTPPYPFRPSIEAAHAIRALKDTP